MIVAAVIVALIALLIVLGRNGGDDDDAKTAVNTVATPTDTKTTGGSTTPASKPATPAVARLRLVPTGEVWVCLTAARGRVLIGGTVISPADKLPTYRSKQFRMTFGNGNLSLRVNGKPLAVPEVKNAIGYEIDRSGRRTVLSPAERPTCS